MRLYQIRNDADPYLSTGKIAVFLKSTSPIAERIVNQLYFDDLVNKSFKLTPTAIHIDVFTITFKGVLLVERILDSGNANPYDRFIKDKKDEISRERWVKKGTLFNITATVLFGIIVTAIQIRGCVRDTDAARHTIHITGPDSTLSPLLLRSPYKHYNTYPKIVPMQNTSSIKDSTGK